MKKVFFLFLIVGGIYVTSEIIVDNFAKKYIEKKISKTVERKFIIDEFKINFLNEEIIFSIILFL